MITRVTLETVLQAFEIPTETWGKGNAKTMDDLLEELQWGESYLRIGPGLARVTRIVRIQIKDLAGQYLMEVKRTLPGGQVREQSLLPGGKIRGNERPTTAMFREAQEELGLQAGDFVSWKEIESHLEEHKGKSFLGLPTFLEVHLFSVNIHPGHQLMKKDECTITEEDGTSHIFRWVTPD